jgi:hypothetical protein
VGSRVDRWRGAGGRRRDRPTAAGVEGDGENEVRPVGLQGEPRQVLNLVASDVARSCRVAAVLQPAVGVEPGHRSAVQAEGVRRQSGRDLPENCAELKVSDHRETRRGRQLLGNDQELRVHDVQQPGPHAVDVLQRLAIHAVVCTALEGGSHRPARVAPPGQLVADALRRVEVVRPEDVMYILQAVTVHTAQPRMCNASREDQPDQLVPRQVCQHRDWSTSGRRQAIGRGSGLHHNVQGVQDGVVRPSRDAADLVQRRTPVHPALMRDGPRQVQQRPALVEDMQKNICGGPRVDVRAWRRQRRWLRRCLC